MKLVKLFNADCPDPSVLYHEGYLYLYGSRAFNSKGTNIQVWRSDSLNGNWESMGDAITQKPEWGKKSTEFWSPDVPIRVGNMFRLYYATNPDTTDGMAIAMAESPVPYNFKPTAQFLLSGEGYSAVDPFVLHYEKAYWLFWGSQHEPIRYRKLNSCGTAFAKDSDEKCVLFPSLRKYERLLEGFFLKDVPQLHLWVAFVSGSDTWSPDSYGVTVFTAPTPFGPFTRQGMLVKPTKTTWAPGQNSVVTIDKIDYFICHAVDSNDPYLPRTKKLKRVPHVALLKYEKGKIILSEVT